MSTSSGSLFEFLENCAETDNFFLRICLKDETERKAAVSHLIHEIHGWLSDPKSPEYQKLVHFYIASIVRLATQNPFDDIRLSFKELVDKMTSHYGILIPEYYDPNSDQPSMFSPSSFVAPKNLVSIHKDKDTTEFLQRIFLSKGRVPYIFRAMAYYTSYATKYERVYDAIMNGPLLPSWANYLAILAASRHNCRYLIVNQQVEFLENGGDPQWLEGIEFAPAKIQKISMLNALLAHQPWLIKPHHVKELIIGNDGWNLTELVAAVTVLTTFHCLAGFAWGFGINIEIDRRGDFGSKVPSVSMSPEESEVALPSTNNVDLISKLRSYEKSDSESTSSLSSNPEIASRHFEESEIGWQPEPKVQNEASARKNVNDFKHYLGKIDLQHQDFQTKSQDPRVEYKIFRLQEFSWGNQGFALMNRYSPDVGEKLDELFNETLDLTDNFLFDSENIDTSPFRQAVWYYVLRLNGMFHDDYDYSQVNQCLPKELKKYIKEVACYPEWVTKASYQNLGVELFDSEKAHINFLIMESRRQAELLYFLNATLTV